jgi:hypothetical protein
LQVEVQITSPFAALGTVYNMLQKHEASAGGEVYQDDGLAQLMASVDMDKADSLCKAIADATSGQVVPSVREVQDVEI